MEQGVVFTIEKEQAVDLACSLVQEFANFHLRQDLTEEEKIFLVVANQDFLLQMLTEFSNEEKSMQLMLEKKYWFSYFQGFLEQEIEDFGEIKEYEEYYQFLVELKIQLEGKKELGKGDGENE